LEGLIFRAKLKYWRTVSDYRELGIDVFDSDKTLAPEIQEDLLGIKQEYINLVRQYFSYPASFDPEKVDKIIKHSPVSIVMTDIDETYLKGQGFEVFHECVGRRFITKEPLLKALLNNLPGEEADSQSLEDPTTNQYQQPPKKPFSENKPFFKTLYDVSLIFRSEKELARHLDEIYQLLFDGLPINELRNIAGIAANPDNILHEIIKHRNYWHKSQD
jgi:hypothetical protein